MSYLASLSLSFLIGSGYCGVAPRISPSSRYSFPSSWEECWLLMPHSWGPVLELPFSRWELPRWGSGPSLELLHPVTGWFVVWRPGSGNALKSQLWSRALLGTRWFHANALLFLFRCSVLLSPSSLPRTVALGVPLNEHSAGRSKHLLLSQGNWPTKCKIENVQKRLLSASS